MIWGYPVRICRNDFRRMYFKNTFGWNESRSGGGSDLVQTAEIRLDLPQG